MIWKGETTERILSEPILSVREERSCFDVERQTGYGTGRPELVGAPRTLAVPIPPPRGNSRFPDPFPTVRIRSFTHKKQTTATAVNCFLERQTGFEPATFSLARRHSTTELLPQFWCRGTGSNRRRRALQALALPTELPRLHFLNNRLLYDTQLFLVGRERSRTSTGFPTRPLT